MLGIVYISCCILWGILLVSHVRRSADSFNNGILLLSILISPIMLTFLLIHIIREVARIVFKKALAEVKRKGKS